jgi:hypothetical protein
MPTEPWPSSVVVGVNRHRAGSLDMRFARGERVGIARARDHELRAVTLDTFLLGGRGDVGHENRGGHTQSMRGIGDRHAMIAA